MMETFSIFLLIIIIVYAVFAIEKEESKEQQHNEEGIDNPYYKKDISFFRTIKSHRKNRKTLKGG